MRRYVINKKPINEFVSTLNAQINTTPELNFQKFLDFFFNLCSRKSSNSITKHGMCITLMVIIHCAMCGNYCKLFKTLTKLSFSTL